ncbi:MAG TPA: lamin tail domain-containing protein, partial [Candidatus Nitrosotalea sp.]|nr:lamin tail domain-containing protein [Candidatus Nitrosotalea sp.]
SNWRLDGADFTFPGGSVIAPTGFLVVASDAVGFENAYGTSIPIVGEFNGKLSNGGETLKLVKPGATPAQDTIINQVTYDSVAPWPTAANGFGPSLQLIDPTQDNNRVANWAAVTTNAAAPTPQWQFVSVTGTATTSRLYVYSTAGDVYIDDIQLVAGSSPGVGQNYVQDGDFESGLGSPWNVTANCAGSSISSTIKHSGNGALHLVCAANGSTMADSIWQDMGPLATNATYTLSYWFLPNTNGGTLTIRLSGSGTRSDQNILFSPNLNSVEFTPGKPNSTMTNLSALPLVWLNEVQPNNVTGITDHLGHHHPWVELYNSGTNTIDLAGYYLSDDYTNLTQWVFTNSTPINPGQFLYLFADGNPAESVPGELHTSFAIPPVNGSVVLSRIVGGQTVIVDYLNYKLINADRSYGAFPDGTPAKRESFYFATPGLPNTNGYPAFPITINEWMAANASFYPDPADGHFDDWFELYNAGPTDVDLTGFTLTDNLTNTTQFTVPSGYFVPANGYLLVWADNDVNQNTTNSPNLHVNFKLSQSGEAIGLYAPNGTNIDSVIFGQQTNDVSQGRWPDGNSGSFYFMTVPTPGGPNTIGTTVSNQPPVLASIGNKAVAEGTQLTFTAVATDPNSGQTLIFTLDPGAPTGTAINPNSGVFTWTPTEDQGPGSYPVTVRVTDNGSPPLSDFETITINVSEVNVAPTLDFIPDKAVNEGTLLSFTAVGHDTDLPAQTLTYSLDPGAPAGANLDSSSGLFTWTPTEAQGPGIYPVTIRVTDNGSPSLSGADTINITVAEINAPPVLSPVANTNVVEMTPLSLQLIATDPDLPANILTFAMVSGPTGAGVNSNSGLFTWTPTEAQGPSTNLITVKVSDNGVPSMSATQSFTVFVLETNSPPVLATISDQFATVGVQLIVNASATDADIPTNSITYSLDTGAPNGAAIGPATGVFTWTPAANQAPSTNFVTVRATDNGVPPLSDTKTFRIVANSLPPLRVTSVSMAANGQLTLTWDSVAGKIYQLEYKDNLDTTSWSPLGTPYTATGPSTSVTNNTTGTPLRFYRINQTN